MANSVNIAQSPRDPKLTCLSETDFYPIVDHVFLIALATSFDRVVDHQHQDRSNHSSCSLAVCVRAVLFDQFVIDAHEHECGRPLSYEKGPIILANHLQYG